MNRPTQATPRAARPASALLLATMIAVALASALNAAPPASTPRAQPLPQGQNQQVSIAAAGARIQLAILLDTSSSMDGLIDQARQQLWSAVNELARARRDGARPQLQVAVYEYGNSGLPGSHGYTRQVLGLTGELDRVSEALFALTTNGGEEWCGYAIAQAVDDLQWSTAQGDVRAIFIAGNEPFTQGPRPFAEAIAAARARGIVVNTIHAGDYQGGVSGGWQQGALLAGGSYMSIDHNRAVVHVEAPQDAQIASLNAELNQTYLPFGKEGARGAERQRQEDSNSAGVSASLLAQRAQSKASPLYDNAQWDLVDALEADQSLLETLEPAALPAPMQAMPAAERETFVRATAERRAELQVKIAGLSRDRDRYVAAQREEDQGPDTLQDALTGAVRAQAADKRFTFDEG